MNDRGLNIRAAIVLGLEADYGFYLDPFDDEGAYLSEGDLEFTTSHDWANLGIEEVRKRIPGGFGLLAGLGEDRTPEEVTERWVFQLEELKNEYSKKDPQ